MELNPNENPPHKAATVMPSIRNPTIVSTRLKPCWRSALGGSSGRRKRAWVDVFENFKRKSFYSRNASSAINPETYISLSGLRATGLPRAGLWKGVRNQGDSVGFCVSFLVGRRQTESDRLDESDGRECGPVIYQFLRRRPIRAQFAQTESVVPFGQADAGMVGNQGAMIELRGKQPQGSIEKDLASSGLEQVFATDDFRDGHGGIIHDDSELIGGQIIVTPNDEISEIASGDELL